MSPTANPEVLNRELDALLVVRVWAVAEAFMAKLSVELESLGLTVSAFRLIGEVMREPRGLRQGELARRLRVSAPTVSAAVTKMEGAGVLQRRPDPSDPRATRVCLAPNAPLSEGATLLRRLELELSEGLDASERDHAVELLGRLFARLSAKEGP